MRTPIIALALLLAAPALAQPRRIDDPRVQDTLEALKLEPTIQQTQAAALQFFNIDPDTVSGMRTRAALKALLPTVEGSVRVNDSTVDSDTIDRINFSEDVPALVGATGADVFEYGVSARWNLPQLVFNSEVLDVSSLAVLQEGVLKEVTRLYYTRRRLQVDLALNPADDAATRLSKELRIEELTATLDAMTGNLFSRQAARAARASRVRPAPRRRR
ncbi:MAG: hypothetical protein H6704_15980 [Myxococcales bacterium]|nr:hypothetical protein [Myxococcales bacterium]